MKKCFELMLSAMASVLCLASSANAQNPTAGSIYRVTDLTTGLVSCYSFLFKNGQYSFHVSTNIGGIVTSTTGKWGALPVGTGQFGGTVFQSVVYKPTTTIYSGSTYIDPNTGIQTIAGATSLLAAGVIIPSVFTGQLDLACTP
jgi:hypothetical protein